jgi:hypothetical protein
MNGNVLANASSKDRSSTDFYPTPENVTIALMGYLDLPKTTAIWEPACGEGHMSKVLEKLGFDVNSSDLHDRGYGINGIDFLQTKRIDIDRSEWIITNPPFSLSEQFIRKCIEHKLPFAMLLKSQYWHSAKRRKLFEEHRPKAVLPLTWRPDFLFGSKSGSPTMECIWTVWGTEPADCTIYYPLSKLKAEV